MRPEDRYDSLIRYYAERRSLEWMLVKAQIRQESNFDPDVVNRRSGAVGLMQFMPRTWQEWRDETPGIQLPADVDDLIDPKDPEDSIRSGTAYMRHLLDYAAIAGEVPKALAAYNWGIGNLRNLLQSAGSAWRDRLPNETGNYLNRIAIYRDQYATEPDPQVKVIRLERVIDEAKAVLARM